MPPEKNKKDNNKMTKQFRNLLKWVAIGTFIHLHTVYDNGNYAIWREQFTDFIPIIWDIIKYTTEIILVLYILFLVCKLDIKKFVFGPLAVDIPTPMPLNDTSSSEQRKCTSKQGSEEKVCDRSDLNTDTQDNRDEPSEQEIIDTEIVFSPDDLFSPVIEVENQAHINQGIDKQDEINSAMTPPDKETKDPDESFYAEEPGYDLYQEALRTKKMSYAQMLRDRLNICGNYVRKTLAIFMNYQDINTLMVNVQKWHEIQDNLRERLEKEANNCIPDNSIDIDMYKDLIEEITPLHQHSTIIDKQLCSIDLFHLAWNIGQCFGWNGKSRAIFIKACFPKNLQEVTLLTVKNNLKKKGTCKISISDLIAEDVKTDEKEVA